MCEAAAAADENVINLTIPYYGGPRTLVLLVVQIY